jgi:hypothetical protein
MQKTRVKLTVLPAVGRRSGLEDSSAGGFRFGLVVGAGEQHCRDRRHRVPAGYRRPGLVRELLCSGSFLVPVLLVGYAEPYPV